MKKISTLIMALLILGIATTGLYSFMNALSSSEGGYDVDLDSDKYLVAFNKIENISIEVNETYTEIQALTANTESTIGIVTLVPKVLIMVKNILTLPFNLVGGMVFAIQDYVGLPTWITLFILTILVIYIIFSFITLVTGRDA